MIKHTKNMLLSLVFPNPDVSDTILYLLLGTTEPAEIENGEVSVDQIVNQHKVKYMWKLNWQSQKPQFSISVFVNIVHVLFFPVAFIKKSSGILWNYLLYQVGIFSATYLIFQRFEKVFWSCNFQLLWQLQLLGTANSAVLQNVERAPIIEQITIYWLTQ